MLTRDQVSQKLAAAARLDPDFLRFGAGTHRYTLGPPLGAARVAEIERGLGFLLPADYRQFAMTVAGSGAGPGHGLVTPDHPAQLDARAKSYFTSPTIATIETVDGKKITGHSNYAPNQEGLLLLADQGCTKMSMLVINGEEPGAVYTDLRCIDDDYAFEAESFTAWYSRWLDGLGAELETPPLGDPSRCAPPQAISNYLRAIAEKRKGSADAQLGEDEVRQALLEIGDGGLATRCGGERFFADQQPVRLCASCQQMVANFVDRGMMRWAQLGAALGTLPEEQPRAAEAAAGGAGPAADEDPVLLPGCRIQRLGDYAAFMKELQRGDLMGALSRRGIAMADYAGVAMQWGQLMAANPQVMQRYAALLSAR